MKRLLNKLPFLLVILFELVAGIMLFVQPEIFTRIMIILFGCVMIAFGVIHIVNFLRNRESGASFAFALTLSVVLMLIGLVTACFSGAIYQYLLPFPVILFGIILVIFGIFKIGFFFDMKKADSPHTIMLIINGIVTVICGAIITCRPLDALETLWRIAGAAHIVMAVSDGVALFLRPKSGKKPAQPAETTGTIEQE